uniref:Vacuolar protein sorting-associated protein 18 homolog n=1 Tax=Syphacia muris TaxID=451379 RepID=A0A0N5ALM7_9BILA
FSIITVALIKRIKIKTFLRPKGNITHVTASNGELVLTTNARDVLHISAQNVVNKQADIVLPLSTHDRIAYVHVDIGGTHAILSSTSGENFYVNLKSNQQRPFKRAKDNVITAVGWNSSLSTDNETSFIALGTNKGKRTLNCFRLGNLYETLIQSGGSCLYFKELNHCLTGIKGLPVTNMELFKCDDRRKYLYIYDLYNCEFRWALCICYPGRLYCLTAMLSKVDSSASQPVLGTMWSSAFLEQFVPTLQPLFTFKDGVRFHCMDDMQRTLPSAFVIYPKDLSGSLPRHYCWLGADGFTIGEINISAQDGYNMITEGPHIQHRLVNGRHDYPLDIAITEYHVLLLYSDRLEAVSLLNQKRVYEEPIGMHTSQVRGMSRDSVTETVWIYTDSSISRYQPDEETRNVWPIYLERGDFAKARSVTSKLSDKGPYQLVLKKEADKLIAEKNYVGAAELLAESPGSFEVIVSRFLSTIDDRRSGLKRFLELQFGNLSDNSSRDRIRRCVLVLWLIEVQLTELAELRLMSGPKVSSETTMVQVTNERDTKIYSVKKAFEQFLSSPVILECINESREAVYRLMISHADFDNQLFLAKKLKDVKTILDIYLLQMKYEDALEVILEQTDLSYFYKYSPLLIEYIPYELVKAWIEKGDQLLPEKLLPTLYRCQQKPKMVAAAFKYLKNIIRSDKATKPVHNFMISICSIYKSDELLEYLKSFGYEKALVPYDLEYALRICLEKEDLKECSIFLYCVDGLYDEAVSLALTVDVELAKECAKRMGASAEDSICELYEQNQVVPLEVRRNIWLKIARYIIEEQKDVVACITLLKESDDIIKIQDVLPFFPDFASIKHFKEPLCKCLQEHSGKIKAMQRQMKDAAEIAQQIRSDSEKLKKNSNCYYFRLVIIRGSDRCSLCEEVVMSRPFYAFNCRHFFHRDCIEKEVIASFSEKEKARFRELKERERLLEKLLDGIDKHLYQPTKKQREYREEQSNVRLELSDMVTGDCLLCGTVMIKSVATSFYTDTEYKEELTKW